eukprot:gi/632956643/ref/XP_007894059.1/ PREDICTED: uncharacterized protein LOC103180176 [Callorhinchus milii]
MSKQLQRFYKNQEKEFRNVRDSIKEQLGNYKRHNLDKLVKELGKEICSDNEKNDDETSNESLKSSQPTDSDETSISTEVIAQTENEDLEAKFKIMLQNRLCHGEVPFYVRTLAICGYRNAGKSSLLRRLVNEPFQENESITDGIKIGQIDIKKWKRKIDDPSDDLTSMIMSSVINCGKGTPEGILSEQSDSSIEEQENKGGAVNESLTNAVLLKVKEMDRDSQKPEEVSIFRYYDFGGHVEYQQMHLPFLPNHAVYLLVVNLNLRLNDTLPIKERLHRGQKVMDTCGFTVKEYLDYWITFICNLCKDTTPMHRVVLVGTFSNDCRNAEEALSTVYDYIQEHFPPDVLHAQRFAVDNSVEQDQENGYAQLRSAIDGLAGQVAFEDKIAVSHASLYYHILNCSEKYFLCSNMYSSWYEIMGSPHGVEVSSVDKKQVVKAALDILNCMKFAYYSDPVLILDPQWLTDLMASLIPINCTLPPQIQKATFSIQREWMKLVNTGKFSEDLLQYLWSEETLRFRDELLEILKELKLIVHVSPQSKRYYLWLKRKHREMVLCFNENQTWSVFRKDIFNELIPSFQEEWPYIESLEDNAVQLAKVQNADYKIKLELKPDRVLLVNQNEFESDDFICKTGSIVEEMRRKYPTLCLFVDGRLYKAFELFLQVRQSVRERTEAVTAVKIFVDDQPEKQKDIFFRDQSINVRFDITAEEMVLKIEERMLIKALGEVNRFHGPKTEEVCKEKLQLLPAVHFLPKGKELVRNLCELLRELHKKSVTLNLESRKSAISNMQNTLHCCVIQCMLDTAIPGEPVDYSESQTLDVFETIAKAHPEIPESAIRDILQVQDFPVEEEFYIPEDFKEKLTISIHRLFWIVKLVFVKLTGKSLKEKYLEETISNLYFKDYAWFMKNEQELGELRDELDTFKKKRYKQQKKNYGEWIQSNYSNFVQKMGEGVRKTIVDKLFQNCLNDEEVSIMSSKNTLQDRNRELLEILKGKGDISCKAFLNFFCSADPCSEMTTKIQTELNL